MNSTSNSTSLSQPSRREWQAPRVIQSALGDSEAKFSGAATPDSHFLSNDYGSIHS